jgi:mxaA protein
MRLTLSFLMLLIALPARAGEVSVTLHAERPFGYFVGDLIHAWADISAPADARLSTASLPRPGPVNLWLDLRDVVVEELEKDDRRIWRLKLTYQNFFVALDARNVVIPGFALSVVRPTGAETARAPDWSVGVAPLREIAPPKKERAEDYLRPDGPAIFVDLSGPRRLMFACALAGLLFLVLVARDRAWPPFHKRPARIFTSLARRLAAQARRPYDAEAFRLAIRSVHRALDVSYGASLLSEDLESFLRQRPEFAPLSPSFERFFAASSRSFFSGVSGRGGFDMSELARFAEALAAREKAASGRTL